MKVSERRSLRRVQIWIGAAALAVLALPVAWPRLGLSESAGVWEDVGSSGPGSTAAGPTPGTTSAPTSTPAPGPSGPRKDPGRKLHPTVIPTRGTIIKPQGLVRQQGPVKDACHFFQLSGGVPVGYNPRRVIPFVVRRTAGPPDGLELVLTALQRISNATGYRFSFQGLTEDLPTAKSDVGRNDLWIGWAFDDEVPDLRDPSGDGTTRLGVGGPSIQTGLGSRPVIVGGSAALRADQDTTAGFGRGESMGNVLLHELTHALGVQHTATDGTLMYPTVSTKEGDGLDPSAIRALQSLFNVRRC